MSEARAAVDRSFEELYRGHRADVFRAALRELGNVHDAEDVTQAAFVDAYRAVLRGSEPHAPRAWLLAIGENVRRRRFRRAQRRPREEPLDADFPLAAELPHELAHALAEALAELPDEQRRVFVLRELGGLSYDEIAEATDSTVGAIQMLLFRARRTLRERLEPPSTGHRRRGLVVPLPGWLTGLASRAEVATLTPRAAGAAGAAAAALVTASVGVNDVNADRFLPASPERRPAVESNAPADGPGRAAPARTAAAAPASSIRARGLVAVVRSRPQLSAAAAAPATAPAVDAAAPTPAAAAPQTTMAATPTTIAPAAPPVTAARELVPSVATLPSATTPPGVTTVPEVSVPETPRLPAPLPAATAEIVDEKVEALPELPATSLSTAPVVDAVAGAASAAGAGALPLPVPVVPPVTLPPAP